MDFQKSGNADRRMTSAPTMMEGSDDDELLGPTVDADDRKQRRLAPGVGRRVSSTGISCQAEKCTADLTEAKRYHRRHKVCEFHAKAHSVLVSGLRQRFCQQCSRFHELSEFDDSKRSCRRRLAGHNERRRKSTADPNQGESSAPTSASSMGRPKGPIGSIGPIGPSPQTPQCRPADHERASRVSNQMAYSSGNPAAAAAAYQHFHIR